jgi:hypothetical protein
MRHDSAHGAERMLRKDGWREPAGWLLAAALLAVIVFRYVMYATHYFSGVPGDLLDARFNSVILEHLYRFVTGAAAQLWSPDYFYPLPSALAFGDNHFGSAFSYVLARLLGLSREHAFGVWFAAAVLLNFASALYVLRRFGASTMAAALGAFFFTCALPATAQDGHAQLGYRFAGPLAVLAHWEMFERRRLADFARVAFFTAWQFYCSIYLGVFLVYLLAALTAAILYVRWPAQWQPWRAGWAAERVSGKLAVGAVVLLSAFAVAYLLGSYFVVQERYGFESQRPLGYISDMLPRPASYLITEVSWLVSWVGRLWVVPVRCEHQLFIGFGAIALIFAAWRGRAAAAELTRVMLIAVALLIAGTLWIADYISLYYLISWLPGIKGIRAVSRIILIMLVPLSVLVALGADAAWRRFGRSALTAAPALAVVVALVVVEPLTGIMRGWKIAQWQQRLDAVKALLPPDLPKDAILLVRTSSRTYSELIATELDAMVLGQDLGYPVLNGYAAFEPPGYRIRPCVPAEERYRRAGRYVGADASADYARRLVVLDLGNCTSDSR